MVTITYVWRGRGETFKPKNTAPAVIILWGYCAASGIGRLYKVDESLKVIQINFKSIERLNLGHDRVLRQDNETQSIHPRKMKSSKKSLKAQIYHDFDVSPLSMAEGLQHV